MARYEVLETSYLNGRVHNAGEIVEIEGPHGPNLKPLDAVVAKSTLPPAVVKLVELARQRAASRGDSPDNANEGDIDSVIADGTTATAKNIAAAKAELASPTGGV